MAHPPPSTTPANTMAWERRTLVDRVASLSNFRDHVPGNIATSDNQQPAPSTYIPLMYNKHYTLSTNHYRGPTDTWGVYGTYSLSPADYTCLRTTQAPTRTAGRTSKETPTSWAGGGTSPWTRCSPFAAAARASAGRCSALPNGPNGPGIFPQSGEGGRSPSFFSGRRPARTARDPPLRAPSQSSSARTCW